MTLRHLSHDYRHEIRFKVQNQLQCQDLKDPVLTCFDFWQKFNL